jgi:hypothetical protein
MWTGIRLTGDFYLRVEKVSASRWAAELTDYPTGAVLTAGQGATAEAACGAVVLAYFDYRWEPGKGALFDDDKLDK